MPYRYLSWFFPEAVEKSAEYVASNFTATAGNASEILCKTSQGLSTLPLAGKYVKVGGARTWASYCKPDALLTPAFYLNSCSFGCAAGSVLCETASYCTGVPHMYGVSVALGAAGDVIENMSPSAIFMRLLF
jgi:hypothetical protein